MKVNSRGKNIKGVAFFLGKRTEWQGLVRGWDVSYKPSRTKTFYKLNTCIFFLIENSSLLA